MGQVPSLFYEWIRGSCTHEGCCEIDSRGGVGRPLWEGSHLSRSGVSDAGLSVEEVCCTLVCHLTFVTPTLIIGPWQDLALSRTQADLRSRRWGTWAVFFSLHQWDAILGMGVTVSS